MVNKRLRITRSEDWSWTRRFLTFFGMFGGLWLFLEPLFAAFGGSGPLSSLGIWRYLILIVITEGLAIIVEIMDIRRVIGNMKLISFTIVMMESGIRYEVEAPQDMRTEDFVNLFLEKVSKNAHPKTSLTYFDLYNNVLMIRVNDIRWCPAFPSKSLKENGVETGNEYRIEGRIKDEFVRRKYLFARIGTKR